MQRSWMDDTFFNARIQMLVIIAAALHNSMCLREREYKGLVCSIYKFIVITL